MVTPAARRKAVAHLRRSFDVSERRARRARTLEIGLAFGASTLVFCAEHQKLGRDGTKQDTAIDPFQARHWYDEAGVFAVERAGLKGYLDYRLEFSEFVLPRPWKQARGMILFLWMVRTCSRMSFSMPSIAPGCSMMAGCSSFTTRLIRTSPRQWLSFAAT
jgi:hypothetical protein